MAREYKNCFTYHYKEACNGLVGLQRLEAIGLLPHTEELPELKSTVSKKNSYIVMKNILSALIKKEDWDSLCWFEEGGYVVNKKIITTFLYTHSLRDNHSQNFINDVMDSEFFDINVWNDISNSAK